jgi:hypothetical protein
MHACAQARCHAPGVHRTRGVSDRAGQGRAALSNGPPQRSHSAKQAARTRNTIHAHANGAEKEAWS